MKITNYVCPIYDYVATLIHMFTGRHMYRFAGSFVHNCIPVQIVDLWACLTKWEMLFALLSMVCFWGISHNDWDWLWLVFQLCSVQGA